MDELDELTALDIAIKIRRCLSTISNYLEDSPDADSSMILDSVIQDLHYILYEILGIDIDDGYEQHGWAEGA